MKHFKPMTIPISMPSYYVLNAMADNLGMPAENIAAELVSTCIAIVGCDADYLNTEDLQGKIRAGLHDAGDDIREFYAQLQWERILGNIKRSTHIPESHILRDYLERHSDDETEAH